MYRIFASWSGNPDPDALAGLIKTLVRHQTNISRISSGLAPSHHSPARMTEAILVCRGQVQMVSRVPLRIA